MKLVRDKIPDLHARGELGPVPHGVDRSWQVFRKATPEEYRMLLLVKLAEEVGEVVTAMTRENLLEELGDLEDVIHALKVLEKYDDHDARRAHEKNERRGAFDEGWILEWKETS